MTDPGVSEAATATTKEHAATLLRQFAEAKSPVERAQRLESIVEHARKECKLPLYVYSKLSDRERALCEAQLEPEPCLQFLLREDSFTPDERCMILTRCAYRGLRCFPLSTFSAPCWDEAIRCCNAVDVFPAPNHTPEGLAALYDKTLAVEHREHFLKALCRRLCSSGDEKHHAAIAILEPSLSDREWDFVCANCTLEVPRDVWDGPLDGDGVPNARMQRLYGTIVLRSNVPLRAMCRAMKRYRVDPLKVERAPEELVEFAETLKELWAPPPPPPPQQQQ